MFAMDVDRGFVIFYVGHGRGRCPMEMPYPYGPCWHVYICVCYAGRLSIQSIQPILAGSHANWCGWRNWGDNHTCVAIKSGSPVEMHKKSLH